ncbi:hypothetical protein VTK73DRAFT_7343 [Phialemonium thermophilum]|uniref:BZIP domain-containing protein n=1 Tax=Phialemonium thermophilum TaxID=223376 RepID=A0ABR3WFJ3_9PEZI
MTAFAMQSYYAAPLAVDTAQNHKYFDDEPQSTLDDAVMEQTGLDSGLEMSPHMAGSRRDSFAVSTSLFSPRSEDWQSSVDMQSIPSNNPFEQHSSSNPFVRLDQAPHPSSAYGAQGSSSSWAITTSGSTTPLHAFDGLPSEFDASVSLFHRPETIPTQPPFGGNPAAAAAAQVPMFQQLGQHPTGSPPLPPASSQKSDWTNQGLRDQAAAVAKRSRPTADLIRSHNDLRRGDGIRKKNARFDIPAERNLSNIDQLIAQSTDEQEIKELKQQKRLLRNRQAALDSRQRKKLHTERLEDEKKQYTEIIAQMEQELADLKERLDQALQENQRCNEYIESLNMQKEQMISDHTIETGELRKKVNILTSHVQTLESQAMATTSSMQSHPAYHQGSFGDMDGLTMVDGSWDNMSLFGEFPVEQQPPSNEVKHEMQVIPSKRPEVPLPAADAEKPSQQGGLLFMLFLVGAFVLSSRSTPSIPRVSDDVRAASASLLESVLKDAGVPQAASGLGLAAPQPSGTSWSRPPAPSMSVGGAGASSNMEGMTHSMLGDMTDSLTQPTQEQTNEQVFSLSAAQYNGVSSQDFLSSSTPAERSTSQGRRNLAEALANMRNNYKHSAAEVYTRSLLWDQIPSDVVRSFAKMVAECNAQNNGPQGQP